MFSVSRRISTDNRVSTFLGESDEKESSKGSATWPLRCSFSLLGGFSFLTEFRRNRNAVESPTTCCRRVRVLFLIGMVGTGSDIPLRPLFQDCIPAESTRRLDYSQEKGGVYPNLLSTDRTAGDGSSLTVANRDVQFCLQSD